MLVKEIIILYATRTNRVDLMTSDAYGDNFVSFCIWGVDKEDMFAGESWFSDRQSGCESDTIARGHGS
jgi:hypothetical protein